MTRSPLLHPAGRLLTALAALAWSAVGLAQGFSGTFQTPVDQGAVTVQLTQLGDRLEGYLQGPGVYFELQGWVEEGVGVGVASSAQGQLGFEALVEGDTLGLWFYEVVNGVVLPETEIEVILARVAAAPAAAAPGGGAAGGGALGGARPAPQAGSPVIATGQHASLTEDDAAAFIEALEFVLGQLGYAYTFTPTDRAQALQAIALSFPTLPQADQVVLSQARSIWERVRVSWAAATPAEQQEFALGVLVLAFGEETVRQWVGTGGGGGGGGACTTFEDCVGGYVDGDTWTDTFNAQGCWAAAGCEGYDPSTGTFDYGSFGDY
ncbi:MAG TPA: hypothetical protein VFF08_09785 [Trueperaceae bacterium]|nr:hypothetical protein [Trueperaceae bacterium]